MGGGRGGNDFKLLESSWHDEDHWFISSITILAQNVHPPKPTFGDLQPLGAKLFESYSFAAHLMSVISIRGLRHGPKGQSAT